MAHDIQTKDTLPLTSDEIKKLIALLNHPKLDEVLAKLKGE
jgi:hypothetical protein